MRLSSSYSFLPGGSGVSAVSRSAAAAAAAVAARSSGTTMANKGIGAAPCVSGAQHGSGNRTEHVVTQMTRYAVSHGRKCGLNVELLKNNKENGFQLWPRIFVH